MKKIIIILSVWSFCFLFAGCLPQNADSQLFDAETSIFDSYEMEQTETDCTIKGRVS